MANGAHRKSARARWAKWTLSVVIAMLPVTYGAAYLHMVTPKGFIAYSGGPQWIEPRYSNDEFENRWQRFFRIANWIDRQIRPDVWAGYP